MKIRPDPSTKPYYKCLSCSRFRKSCGGIPTRGMDLQNWCEYMRDVKEVAKLTNAYIAKEADVCIKTIARIMAINIEQDIMRATARRIELVVIGECTVPPDWIGLVKNSVNRLYYIHSGKGGYIKDGEKICQEEFL